MDPNAALYTAPKDDTSIQHVEENYKNPRKEPKEQLRHLPWRRAYVLTRVQRSVVTRGPVEVQNGMKRLLQPKGSTRRSRNS